MIELLITMVIAAVLFGIAIPQMGTLIKNSRITTQINDLMADLNLARSEAIKRNTNVVVCKSNNPTVTPPSCNTTGTDPWQSGRLVFVDVDGSNTYTTAANDVLLRITEPLSGGNSLTPNGAPVENFVSYSRTGLPASALTGAPYFALCDDRGVNFARGMLFETTGRPKIVRKSTFATLTCP